MRSTLLLLFLSLPLLCPANARALLPFRDSSPDDKFEAICETDPKPTLKIIDRASGETVATLDDHVSSRGMNTTWSPDGKRFVVLTCWRRWTEVIVFRRVGGRLERAEGPEIDMEFAAPGRWISPNKLRVEADDYARTLVITDRTASLVR